MLIDKGNGKDLEFCHTDYYTGEGRPLSHSENMKEMHINPELSVKERNQISSRDSIRRNRYHIYLFFKNNIQIIEYIVYNPFTEALSLSWRVKGDHGKRLLNVGDVL